MKRWFTIIGMLLLIAACSFSALYAGIQVGYAQAAADGRVVFAK